MAGRILSAMSCEYEEGPYRELVRLATQVDFDLGQHTLQEFGTRHGRSNLFVSRDQIVSMLWELGEDQRSATSILFAFFRSAGEGAEVILELVNRCQRENQAGRDPRVAMMREFGER